jgi:hypothetical protein
MCHHFWRQGKLMQSAIDALLIVGLSTLISVLGAIIVRKKFHSKDFTEHHEVAGYFLSIVGTMYSVLLGLLVVNVISKFDQARAMASVEANACSDIWQLARGFPPEAKKSIRVPLRNYFNEVQRENWEAVHLSATNETTTVAYQRMWGVVTEYQPVGNREVACYSSVLSSMSHLADARRFRLLSSRRAVSSLIWIVLIAGGVLTVCFTYFFTVQSIRAQIALTAFVALFISLNLLLVKLFDDPYRNDFKIRQEAFSLQRIGEYQKRDASGNIVPGDVDPLLPVDD